MAKKKGVKTFWLNYFRPSLMVNSFRDINVSFIKRNGFKLVICDLDNTLSPHFTRYPNKEVIKFKESIQKNGIYFAICSNNTKKRVSRYCEKLKPDFYSYNSKKPLLGKINKIINHFKISKEEILIIGDQFITDVFVANRIGCKSILVLPMLDPSRDSSTSWLQKLLDKFIYQKLQHKNLKQEIANSGGIKDNYDII